MLQQINDNLSTNYVISQITIMQNSPRKKDDYLNVSKQSFGATDELCYVCLKSPSCFKVLNLTIKRHLRNVFKEIEIDRLFL